MTSIIIWTPESFSASPGLPAFPVHRDLLFIKSNLKNDLITFAKEIQPKMDPYSTYIFTDASHLDDYTNGYRPEYSNRLGTYSRVLISFVAPTSGKSLILRLKHYNSTSGNSLQVTLGSKILLVNPPSRGWSLITDDITLYSIPGPSESNHLSFDPGIRNDIVIHVISGKFHDMELLDEAGLEYMPHSASLTLLSN